MITLATLLDASVTVHTIPTSDNVCIAVRITRRQDISSDTDGATSRDELPITGPVLKPPPDGGTGVPNSQDKRALIQTRYASQRFTTHWSRFINVFARTPIAASRGAGRVLLRGASPTVINFSASSGCCW